MSINRLLRGIINHPRTVLVTALLLALISIAYTMNRLEFLTGRDDLMPKHAPFQQDYQAYRASFGDQEEIAVLIEGDDPLLVSRFGDALYSRLMEEKQFFISILYPGGLDYFRKNGLLFTSPDELQRMYDSIQMVAPVLEKLAPSPSIQTLFSSMTELTDDYLKHPTAEKLQRLTFMFGLLERGFAGFDGKNSPLSIDSLLSGSTDGKPSAMESAGKQQVIAIRPLKETDSFVPAEKGIKKLRQELNLLLQKPEFKGITVGITGVPVLEYEEMSTSMDDMAIASLLSLGLTIILLLFAFRGFKNTVAAMTALLIAISISFGVATLLVGHLNILSMAFAVMLLGLGVEYSIQVVLRHQEVAGSAGFREGLLEALSSNLRPVLLAFITTALAFLTFLLTDFKGIAELGLIAAAGVFVCFISTFTVLPAMLVILQTRKDDERGGSSLPDAKKVNIKTGSVHNLFARPGLIVAGTALLTLASTAALPKVPFDFNMLNLQAKGLESVRYAYKLMKSRENSGYFAVSMAKDNDEARRLIASFEALPAVDHVVAIQTLVPDHQEEKLEILGRIRQVMSGINPGEYEENLRVMELPTVFEQFRNSVDQLVKRVETEGKAEAKPLGSFLATLDRFFAGLEKEQDGNALTMLREMQQQMFEPLPEKLKLLKGQLNARPLTVADLPPQLLERFKGKDGRLLLQIAPKGEIFDEGPLAEFVRQVKSVDPHATGEPVSVYESFKILKKSYLQAFMYALGGVVLILLIAFRSIPAMLLGVAPLATGLMMMVGGMWLCGLRFNVANIIVMPLLLGVGIDSAIYIISRHLKGVESPVEVATSSAGKGVFLNALTILFSFGALMVARHQGVFSIGAVMSLGMSAIVLAFLLFLPALLLLLDRHGKPDSTEDKDQVGAPGGHKRR